MPEQHGNLSGQRQMLDNAASLKKSSSTSLLNIANPTSNSNALKVINNGHGNIYFIYFIVKCQFCGLLKILIFIFPPEPNQSFSRIKPKNTSGKSGSFQSSICGIKKLPLPSNSALNVIGKGEHLCFA